MVPVSILPHTCSPAMSLSILLPPFQYPGGAGILPVNWACQSDWLVRHWLVGKSVAQVGDSISWYSTQCILRAIALQHRPGIIGWPFFETIGDIWGDFPKAPNTSEHVLFALCDTWHGLDALKNIPWGVEMTCLVLNHMCLPISLSN